MANKKSTTSKKSASEIALQESLEQNVRKRKRRKILLRIVLLILLLLLLFVSIGVYFLINRPHEKKEIVLSVTIAPYTVQGEEEQQVARPKEFHYERGEETSGEEILVYDEVILAKGQYFRLDYEVKNLSTINYTYIIDLSSLEAKNCIFQYQTNLTPFEQDFPYGNKLVLSYNKDFTFSVIIKVDKDYNYANCSGNIYFSIEIQGQD